MSPGTSVASTNASAPVPQSAGYERLLVDFLLAQDITPGSRATYKSALTQFFSWLAEHPGEKPSRETILHYKEFLAQKGLQTYTPANYIVAVRRFFEWTESTLKYPNIAKGVKGVRRSTKTHHKHALTTVQIMQLLDSIKARSCPSVRSRPSILRQAPPFATRVAMEGRQDERRSGRTGSGSVGGKNEPADASEDERKSISQITDLRDYALINLLFRTGLRLIEIRRAAIADLETRTKDAVLWIHGKGREGKDEFIVVPADALTPITEYLNMRKPDSSREPLFASLSDRNFGKCITTNSLSRIIKQRLRMAGMDNRRITAHSLRHTFGVMAITAGASLYDVQLAMRHTSPATTEIYLGDIEQEKRLTGGAEQRVDELFKKLSQNN